MFVAILLRSGETHIVDFTLNNGKQYRTICSKTFSKSLKMNTLAADNTFPGTCQTCKAYYDEMYLSDLNVEPRMARNQSGFRFNHLVDYHRYEMEGPRARYEDSISKHWWPKLVKYQRLLQKR